MPRAVLFDFGGTLDGDGEHWSVRFHRAYRGAGGALEFGAFDPIFKESDRRLERHPGIAALGFRDTVAAQADILAGLLPDGAALRRERVVEAFCDEAMRVAERNAPVLAALKERWTLGVVSNFTGNLAPCLAELGLDRWISVALDSTVVGVAKPDARIFRMALEAVGVEAGRAWMVGDNFEADVRPAAQLGLSTCWVAPAGRVQPEARQGVPTQRISALPQLAALLETACTD